MNIILFEYIGFLGIKDYGFEIDGMLCSRPYSSKPNDKRGISRFIKRNKIKGKYKIVEMDHTQYSKHYFSIMNKWSNEKRRSKKLWSIQKDEEKERYKD